MDPFTKHTGRFITLDRANVDTDQIIPARYLKRIERTGYGDFLFEDLRQKGGAPDPEFPLHRPEAEGATVLVARQNFGCGSSREHAVWAISQWGFRAVVAPRVGSSPGFADIFRGNAYKNGLLPLEVEEAFVDRLFQAGTGSIAIDLAAQTVTAELPDGAATARFEIQTGAKEMLLRGLDEIGLTLEHADAITAYEAAHARLAPQPA